VASYATLITGDRLAKSVIKDSGVPLTPAQFKKQIEEARKADAEAVAETPATYSSTPEETDGEASATLASDEALAALREKLTGQV